MLVMNVKSGELFMHKGSVYKLTEFAPGKAKAKVYMFLRQKRWQFFKSTSLAEFPLTTIVQKVRVEVEILQES